MEITRSARDQRRAREPSAVAKQHRPPQLCGTIPGKQVNALVFSLRRKRNTLPSGNPLLHSCNIAVSLVRDPGYGPVTSATL
jgi:hypothetical protein